MIFYTLTGPGFKLEIHDDKLQLIKHSWWSFLSHKNKSLQWELNELSQFEMTPPRLIFLGKVDWVTKDGKKGSFRFLTSAMMVQKIEKYMQKRIIKNNQKPIIHDNSVIKRAA